MNLAPPLPSASAWRRLAPGLLLMVAVLLVFRDTAAAMVAIWIRSETFAHAFLVPPIVAWLVWRQRAQLAVLQLRPMPWLMLAIAALCLLWVLGELVGVNTATQLALVAILVLSVPAVYGLQVASALMFPLLFLFFAVPIGEFMVPSMMEWTANFTIAALRWSGVPVYREGLQFVIPNGNWSVIEACSGIRYLIASFMVGTLFAYLNFNSWRRRSLFMVVSLLVPLAANWLRAYMIVMLGYLSGNRIATGFDHIIYGWLFFGTVIGVMFMIGARWAEPDAPPAPIPAEAVQLDTRLRMAWGVSLGVVALALVTQMAFRQLDRPHLNSAPIVALPAGSNGWVATDKPLSDWVPDFKGPRAVALGSYRGDGVAVGVWIGYYRDQGYDHKLVSSTNVMLAQDGHDTWALTSSGMRRVPIADHGLTVLTGDLRGSASPGAPLAPRLRVWQLYWVGGRFMINGALTRLQVGLNRLLGRGDDGAVIFLYTQLPDDQSAGANEAADQTLARFLGTQLQPLAEQLTAASRMP